MKLQIEWSSGKDNVGHLSCPKPVGKKTSRAQEVQAMQNHIV